MNANTLYSLDHLQKVPSGRGTAAELASLVAANQRYRKQRWPEPFDHTTHQLVLGDARNLDGIDDATVHLIVTSPPYWTLKKYPDADAQLGSIDDYESFLSALDRVWRECERVLFQEDGSAVWSATCACPAEEREALHRPRSTPTSRSAPVRLVWTVSPR